jgi:hypothetical protein
VNFIVVSRIAEVKVSHHKVEKSLSKSSTSKAIARVVQNAVLQRLTSFPTSWSEARLTTDVGLGNIVQRDRVENTPDRKLGDYPKDFDGTVACVIVLTGKLPPPPPCVVLPTSANTDHGASAMATQPIEGDEVQVEDTKMHDNIQLSQQRQSTNRPNPERRVDLKIGFVGGLPWSGTKTIHIPPDTSYDTMSQVFEPEIFRTMRDHSSE